jgi:hypothetical protein
MGWIIAFSGGAAAFGGMPWIAAKMLLPRVKVEQAEHARLRQAFAAYMEANPLADPHTTKSVQAVTMRALEEELHRLRAREESLRMRRTVRPVYHAESDIMAPSHGAGGDIISDLYDE